MYSSNVQKSPASTVDIPTSARVSCISYHIKEGQWITALRRAHLPRTKDLKPFGGSFSSSGAGTCWVPTRDISVATVATTEATWPCRRWLHRTHDLSHGVTASTQRPSSFILRHPRNLHDGPGSKPQMINHPKPSHGSSGPAEQTVRHCITFSLRR